LPDRFFQSPPLALGEVRLDGAEAHHLLHVLRAKPGLEVVLFDGSGAEFDATVVRTDRATVYLNVSARRDVDREPAIAVTLGVALPKGDRQRWLVEKATELGVARLVPLITSRGVAQPVGAALGRFERAVIEAAKQCGRNRLMEIGEPQSWAEFVAGTAPADAIRLVAHPGGIALSAALRGNSRAACEVWLAIGPEGGLNEPEVRQALDAGWQAVDLGRRLLRTETAAMAIVAMVVLR
jgi:16S rRNA (uracil1498-N3)-methyltransferase